MTAQSPPNKYDTSFSLSYNNANLKDKLLNHLLDPCTFTYEPCCRRKLKSFPPHLSSPSTFCRFRQGEATPHQSPHDKHYDSTIHLVTRSKFEAHTAVVTRSLPTTDPALAMKISPQKAFPSEWK